MKAHVIKDVIIANRRSDFSLGFCKVFLVSVFEYVLSSPIANDQKTRFFTVSLQGLNWLIRMEEKYILDMNSTRMWYGMFNNELRGRRVDLNMC